MYDVIIIGCGPAGMFAANELSGCNLNAVIVDAHGQPGGAGTYIDGKLNLSTEIGMDMQELKIKKALAEELINKIKNTYIKHGAEPRLSGTGIEIHEIVETVNAIRNRYADGRYDITFIPAKQMHMGSDKAPVVAERFKNELSKKGTKFLLKTKVSAIKKDRLFTVMTNKGILKSKYLIAAPGRAGAYWFREQAKQLGVKTNYGRIDVGVRIEFPAKIYKELTKIQYDPKFKFITPTYKDRVRTFCTNPNGWVAAEYNLLRGFYLVNGHARRDRKTKNTNVALLNTIELTRPVADTTMYGNKIAEFANFISGQKPLVQKLGDLRKGRRSTPRRIRFNKVKPTLRKCNAGDIGMALNYRIVTNIMESIGLLSQIAHDIDDDSTLLYAPEIKFYDTKYPTKNMETNAKNLFVAGDGCGKSRGIVGAALSGILAARGVLNLTL